MERLKIDNPLVHSHPAWDRFGSSLSHVASKDYPRAQYFGDLNIDCLDVDSIEISRVKGVSGVQLQETIDCGAGIAAIESVENKRQLILVELRMGYTSIAQVKFEDWRKKYEHSRDLLAGDIPICNRSIYVFSATLAPEVERRRDSLSKVNAYAYLKDYFVLSSDEIASTFVPSTEWPRPCEVEEDNLRLELKQTIQKGNEDELIRFSDYWKKRAIKYFNRYLSKEHETIIRVFREELNSVSNTSYDPLCIELILEEFPEIISSD